MSVWAVIPVKPLNRAKSRLAGVLSAEQRIKLAETTLRKTLEIVTQLPQVTGVLVISRDGRVLSLAREHGAHTVQESGTPELNTALMRASQVLLAWRADAILVLPADIPLINVEDLTRVIKMGQNPATVVIVPDDKHEGTNVLFVRPPGLFSYAYGENSFERHQQLAKLAGATVHVCESEQLSLDLDVPEDLHRYETYVKTNQFGAQSLLNETTV